MDNMTFIAFDISDTKAQRSCVKILKNYAFRIQYSVFAVALSKLQLNELTGKLDLFYTQHKRSGHAQDLLRITVWTLCTACSGKTKTWGGAFRVDGTEVI